MNVGPYSFVDLLSSADDLSQLIDPRVATVSKGLGISTDEVNLAGACLGSSVEIIDSLLQAGLLPEKLPNDQYNELKYQLNSDSKNFRQAIAANREYVTWYLGLPVPSSEPPPPVPTEASPVYPLFPHQRRALRHLFSLLDDRQDRMLLHMPTGSGKTRTTMNIISDILRRSYGGAVLWLASRKELLEQAAHEFAKAWYFLGNREVPIHTAWGSRSWVIDNINDGLLVASPQTLNSQAKSLGSEPIGKLGRNLQLIVFDEAHQAIATTYHNVIEQLAASGQPVTPILGLTATPGRTFTGNTKDEELVRFFGSNKIMLDTSAEGGPTNPVEYLITHEYLASTDFELIGELPTEHSEKISYAPNDEVSLESSVTDYLEHVVQATLDLVKEGHTRILVFAASVTLARQIASILRAAGINAHSVDESTEQSVRDTIIREYKSRTNDPRVLVNYDVLATGFDAPQTSAAVIARPTRSLVLYNQMVGRAIRGPKAGGNRFAKIITVVDPSIPAFGSIAEAFTHWNDYWEGLHA